MLLLRCFLPRVCLWFALALLSLPTASLADSVTISFYPPAGSVAGYKVYVAPETTGAITTAPIDAGARAPGSNGVATYTLSGLDPARAYSVEFTAYDASRSESARSNRLTIEPRVETLGSVLWSNDFAKYAPGVHVPGFADEAGDTRTTTGTDLFSVTYFSDGNATYGTSVDFGAVASHYVGPGSSNWGPYELSGRVFTTGISGGAGIAARVTGDPERYFELGQLPGGSWLLRASNENALTCKSLAALGVTQAANVWYFFRYRVTQSNGLTRLRAKVWRAGTTMPASWQADCWTTLSAPVDAGSFAIRRGGAGGVYYDNLAVTAIVGTLDPIPPP